MPFRVVNFFKIRIVRDRFDSLLLRNHLIIASHHHYGSEFQALGKMHGADRSPTTGGLDVVVEHLIGEFRSLDRRTRAVQFGRRADEDSDFVRHDSLADPFHQPLADCLDFFMRIIEDHDVRWWAIEGRDCTPAIFRIAVHVGHFGPQ